MTNFLIFVAGGVLGYGVCSIFVNEAVIEKNFVLYLCFIVIGGLLMLVTKPLWRMLFGNITKQIDIYFKNVTSPEIWAGALGLIVGLIIANLVARPLLNVPVFGTVLVLVVNVLSGYWGVIVALKKKDEIYRVILAIAGGTDNKSLKKADKSNEARFIRGVGKILDTSVIIDGRILDISRSGFIDGPLIVPCFVLDELQHIADSSDQLKRNRGRRGLDILNLIRQDSSINVKIDENDFDDVEVDAKLLKLAQKTGCSIVTNDLNLNKVAALREVMVLNINDLANALRPVVLPGEDMVVQIIKDGKESGQGVAYLDDGTMVVIEGGRRKIGETLSVEVTSVLQTSAGKMIFAKMKTD